MEERRRRKVGRGYDRTQEKSLAETAVQEFFDDAIEGEDVGGGDPGIASLMATGPERDDRRGSPSSSILAAAAAAPSRVAAPPPDALEIPETPEQVGKAPWLRRMFAQLGRARA